MRSEDDTFSGAKTKVQSYISNKKNNTVGQNAVTFFSMAQHHTALCNTLGMFSK